MPFSAAWDEAAPNGATTLASDIDLTIRNLKRDIRERFVSLGVTDFLTDDPIGFRVLRMFDNGGFSAIQDVDNVNIQFFDSTGTIVNAQVFAASGNFSARGNVQAGGSLIGVLLTLSGLATFNGGLTVAAAQPTTLNGPVTIAENVTLNGAQAACTPQSSVAAAAETVDWDLSNNRHFILQNITTTLTFSNPKQGAFYLLKLTQDGTGNRGVVLAGGANNVLWPNNGPQPAISSTANRSDLLSFYFDGFNYFGQVIAYGYNG